MSHCQPAQRLSIQSSIHHEMIELWNQLAELLKCNQMIGHIWEPLPGPSEVVRDVRPRVVLFILYHVVQFLNECGLVNLVNNGYIMIECRHFVRDDLGVTGEPVDHLAHVVYHGFRFMNLLGHSTIELLDVAGYVPTIWEWPNVSGPPFLV